MFRRKFIEAVSVEGQFFDEEFFAFREDADLAWRAQVMGWKCLYVPTCCRLACAARYARTAGGPAAGHQLAFGEKPFPHAGQECVGMALLAVVLSGCVARSDDARIRSGARLAHDIGGVLSFPRFRQHPAQAGHHSGAPPSFRPRFAMVVLQHAAGEGK